MKSIAIIGTGIAGMGCGHFLHNDYDLEFFEQNDYVGGHTNTVTVAEGEAEVSVDTGFIVFNYRTYPNLIRLFQELSVEIKPTNMSFGVQYLPDGLEYGSQKIFAQAKNYLSPSFWRMLFQIRRFHRESEEVLTSDAFASYSLKQYVEARRYGHAFVHKYIIPMSSALWSTPADVTLQYPVRTLVQFFKNHGLLGTDTQFQWHTVSGGSRQYRDKLIRPFKNSIRTGVRVVKAERIGTGARLTMADGTSKNFDKVIFACHADQALRILQNPTADEVSLLSVFEYQKNLATLHSDESVMPKAKATWSAWNYRVENKNGTLTTTTIYDMNCLQQVSQKRNYFVSINDPGSVNPGKVIRRIEYEHPIFTPKTELAQKSLHKLNENGSFLYCGSYFRFGFHEDAFASAVSLCAGVLGRDPWERVSAEKPEMQLSS